MLLNNFFNFKTITKYKIIIFLMGIGDWGLGIGPNPQSPIPNPPSPIPQFLFKLFQDKTNYKNN